MCQFSWFCDGKSDEPVDSATWLASLEVAQAVAWGEYGDITEGATHYHSDSVNPYWADSLNETVVINNHLFYK
jgi:spore germination cell wall hydrolase CwlJ-like protein